MSQLITTTSQTIENGNTTFLQTVTISQEATHSQQNVVTVPALGQEVIRWDEVNTPVCLIIDSPITLSCTIQMAPGNVSGILIKKFMWEGEGFIELIMNNPTSADVSVRFEVYGS
tara:strand:- start:15345 stop:15689 length:345 start_codon:yes stop_codon:yes gene_type:complete